MTRFSLPNTRRLLLAGVSALALTAMGSQIQAADLPARMVTKAPAAVVRDQCNWWVEGGAFDSAGSYELFGVRPNWGGEGAVGVDCRPAAFRPYVFQFQFRYGQAKGSDVFSQPQSFVDPVNPNAIVHGVTSGPADNKEHHWLVDFGVGRDFSLGSGGNFTTKLGVRVAELWSKGCMNGFFNGGFSSSTLVSGPVAFCQRSRFLGVGPRVAIEGNVPVAGRLWFEYVVGVAALFGRRSLDMNATTNLQTSGTSSFLVGSSGLSSSSTATVLNADAQAGFTYWVTEQTAVSLFYRVDAYFNALPTVTFSGIATNTPLSNAIVSNEDRIIHGPMIRLTARLP